MRSRNLKVQVVLHDLEKAQGMIHFLAPAAAGTFAQHGKATAVDQAHWRVPDQLSAGTVVLYNSATGHTGGANTSPNAKVVLDVMFKSQPVVPSGDDTPGRFRRTVPVGAKALEQYREAWLANSPSMSPRCKRWLHRLRDEA